jgi:hypothetical protein
MLMGEFGALPLHLTQNGTPLCSSAGIKLELRKIDFIEGYCALQTTASRNI